MLKGPGKNTASSGLPVPFHVCEVKFYMCFRQVCSDAKIGNF